MESKVDNQVAAPAETRTPNLHRAKIAHRRVRMEGWRQWQLGGREKLVQRKNKRTLLTPTGLLMEGVYTHDPVNECNGDVTTSIGLTLPVKEHKVCVWQHSAASLWCLLH